MNLRDLQYLINLEKTQHFGRAAELSFVSQPTLSMQIKKMEEFLGATLVERQKKVTLLTPAGKIAVSHAKQILGQVSDLKHAIESFHDPLSGDWDLGIFPTLAPYIIPDIISDIAKYMPNLNLRLHELTTDNCIEKLKNRQLDSIIIADHIADMNLESEFLFSEKFYLALHKDHSLANKKVILSNDIPEDEILLLETGHCLREQGLDYCKKIHKSYQKQFAGTSLETLLAMVSLGKGITFIPELSVPTFENYNLAIKSISAAPKRDIYLVWRKSMDRNACIKKWIDILKIK